MLRELSALLWRINLKGVIDHIDVRAVTIDKEVRHWFFWKKIKRVPAWRLLESFDWYGITVPEGFITDFASIPKFAKWYVDPVGIIRVAALVHDYLYSVLGKYTKGVELSRKACDGVFLDIMGRIGMDAIKMRAIYRAVRLGGWYGWNRRKKELGV